MSRLVSVRALATFWSAASIASAAGMFNTIHTFTGSPDGFQPFAGVTIGRGGVLYDGNSLERTTGIHNRTSI